MDAIFAYKNQDENIVQYSAISLKRKEKKCKDNNTYLCMHEQIWIL
jgi:hypothetical protein